MRLPKFDYIAPVSVPEALSLLSRNSEEALLLAGGTDLIVRLRQRGVSPRLLISLNTLPDLDFITSSPGDTLRLGPLASIHSVETSAIIRPDFGILALAAGKIASPQIRNTATLGGNLCLDPRCWFYNKSYSWRRSRPPCFKTGGALCHVVKHGKRCYALFSGDMAPALVVLDARVRLSSFAGQRVVPLLDVYSGEGSRPLKLSPGEILTEIEVPRPGPRSGAAYLKYSHRKAVDFAIASIAVSLSLDPDGACSEARIAIGSVSPAPVRATRAEHLLQGSRLSAKLPGQAAGAVLKDIGAVVSIGAPVDYKKKIITDLVGQAIRAAWESAGRKPEGKA
ncbi:MAG: FAD binding domain-containing protein [Chloroflexi bacterium]|nr:FAD binding domain-containing protein [Chloroflexota bacterium]